MKKFVAVLLVALMTLSLAACGSSSSGTSDSNSSGTDSGSSSSSSSSSSTDYSKLKVGFLIPGSPTDGGFSQRAVEAAEDLKTKYPGCQTSVVQAATAEEIKQEASNMADSGFTIVFGHGGQCSSPFKEICADYPDVWFGTMGGQERDSNLFEVNMCFEQITYVIGAAAALTSNSGVIAWQTGGDYASYTKTTNSYELGAKSVKSDIQVKGQVLSSTDPTEGYETALSQIDAGASFVLSNTNEAQSGAVKACKEKGVYTCGVLGAFKDQAPDQVMIDTFVSYSKAYQVAVQEVLDGKVEQQIDITPQKYPDIMTWEWNDTVKSALSADVVSKVESIWSDVKAGNVKIPDEFEYGATLNK